MFTAFFKLPLYCFLSSTKLYSDSLFCRLILLANAVVLLSQKACQKSSDPEELSQIVVLKRDRGEKYL